MDYIAQPYQNVNKRNRAARRRYNRTTALQSRAIPVQLTDSDRARSYRRLARTITSALPQWNAAQDDTAARYLRRASHYARH